MGETRTEVFRISDGAPEPDRAFYAVTEEDVGRTVLRLAIGETIDVGDVQDTSGMPWRADAIQPEHVGWRLYGKRNLGYDGPAWYWEAHPGPHPGP